MKMPTLTEDQIASLKEQTEEEKEFFRKTIRDALGPPHISELKSADMFEKEIDDKVEMLVQSINTDSKSATESFFKECPPKDRSRLEEIFSNFIAKIQSYAEFNLNKSEDTTSEELKSSAQSELNSNEINDEFIVNYKDCEFLEEIVKAKFLRNDFSGASCMYRFIININPSFSSAWVGWALCETEQGNIEIADYIYQLARNVMPNDYFICLFAADFYISIDQKDKAKEILENAKKQLELDNMENSKTYEQVQLSLNTLL